MAKAKTNDSVSGPVPSLNKFRVSVRNVLVEADLFVEAETSAKALEQVKASLYSNVTAEPVN